eukprot:9583456-Heterocapsa_arctica.AAC.1
MASVDLRVWIGQIVLLCTWPSNERIEHPVADCDVRSVDCSFDHEASVEIPLRVPLLLRVLFEPCLYLFFLLLRHVVLNRPLVFVFHVLGVFSSRRATRGLSGDDAADPFELALDALRVFFQILRVLVGPDIAE